MPAASVCMIIHHVSPPVCPSPPRLIHLASKEELKTVLFFLPTQTILSSSFQTTQRKDMVSFSYASKHFFQVDESSKRRSWIRHLNPRRCFQAAFYRHLGWTPPPLPCSQMHDHHSSRGRSDTVHLALQQLPHHRSCCRSFSVFRSRSVGSGEYTSMT